LVLDLVTSNVINVKYLEVIELQTFRSNRASNIQENEKRIEGFKHELHWSRDLFKYFLWINFQWYKPNSWCWTIIDIIRIKTEMTNLTLFSWSTVAFSLNCNVRKMVKLNRCTNEAQGKQWFTRAGKKCFLLRRQIQGQSLMFCFLMPVLPLSHTKLSS